MARCPGGSSPPFILPLSYQVKMLPHSSLCFHQTFTAQGQLSDNGRRRPVRQLHSVTQTRSTRFWVWVNQSWPADQMLCNYPGLMTLVGWCVWSKMVHTLTTLTKSIIARLFNWVGSKESAFSIRHALSNPIFHTYLTQEDHTTDCKSIILQDHLAHITRWLCSVYKIIIFVLQEKNVNITRSSCSYCKIIMFIF